MLLWTRSWLLIVRYKGALLYELTSQSVLYFLSRRIRKRARHFWSTRCVLVVVRLHARAPRSSPRIHVLRPRTCSFPFVLRRVHPSMNCRRLTLAEIFTPEDVPSLTGSEARDEPACVSIA